MGTLAEMTSIFLRFHHTLVRNKLKKAVTVRQVKTCLTYFLSLAVLFYLVIFIIILEVKTSP